MVQEYKQAAPCGLICNECPWFQGKMESKCPGCLEKRGKPFWGECEVFLCSEMKHYEHCGACIDFPCETIINHFDPNNPKGKQEAIFRVGQLAIRNKIGTKTWLAKRTDSSLPKFEY